MKTVDVKALATKARDFLVFSTWMVVLCGVIGGAYLYGRVTAVDLGKPLNQVEQKLVKHEAPLQEYVIDIPVKYDNWKGWFVTPDPFRVRASYRGDREAMLHAYESAMATLPRTHVLRHDLITETLLDAGFERVIVSR